MQIKYIVTDLGKQRNCKGVMAISDNCDQLLIIIDFHPEGITLEEIRNEFLINVQNIFDEMEMGAMKNEHLSQYKSTMLQHLDIARNLKHMLDDAVFNGWLEIMK